MRKYNFRYSIGIAIILFICFSAASLFAQEDDPEEVVTQNQGNIVSKNIPEQKKYKKEPSGAKQIIRNKSTTKDVSEAAGENKPYSPAEPLEKNLTALQVQARAYRKEGVQAQSIGDLATALKWYQKAVQMDPAYAVVYNDLGVVYELMGNVTSAEQYYFEAIRINPQLLSPYSNLALLYENKGDAEKASFLWKKRVELGSPDDPWTEVARQRCEAIRLATEVQEPVKVEAKAEAKVEPKVEAKVESKVETEEAKAEIKPAPEARPQAAAEVKSAVSEKEILDLVKEVRKERTRFKKENKVIAERYLQQAKESCERGDYASARDVLLDAGQLDPANKEIDDLIDKVQTRALSR